jgi:hypothetical protein
MVRVLVNFRVQHGQHDLRETNGRPTHTPTH